MTSAADADAEWLRRAAWHDDRRAFEQLVLHHQGPIRSLLRRLGADAALADDLAQDTFLAAYRGLQGFRGQAAVRTWLYRIACNAYFQHRRRHPSPFAEVAWDADEFPGDAKPDSSAEGVAACGAEPELVLDLQRALAQLNARERQAILLCCYAEFSHAEAARLLACPLGTVKSLVLRGRQRLQRSLLAWAPAAMPRTGT